MKNVRNYFITSRRLQAKLSNDFIFTELWGVIKGQSSTLNLFFLLPKIPHHFLQLPSMVSRLTHYESLARVIVCEFGRIHAIPPERQHSNFFYN